MFSCSSWDYFEETFSDPWLTQMKEAYQKLHGLTRNGEWDTSRWRVAPFQTLYSEIIHQKPRIQGYINGVGGLFNMRSPKRLAKTSKISCKTFWWYYCSKTHSFWSLYYESSTKFEDSYQYSMPWEPGQARKIWRIRIKHRVFKNAIPSWPPCRGGGVSQESPNFPGSYFHFQRLRFITTLDYSLNVELRVVK